jgi:hypothetical protein
MHTYTYFIHASINIQILLHTNAYTCMNIRMNLHIHTCIHTRLYLYIYKNLYIYIYISSYTHSFYKVESLYDLWTCIEIDFVIHCHVVIILNKHYHHYHHHYRMVEWFVCWYHGSYRPTFRFFIFFYYIFLL